MKRSENSLIFNVAEVNAGIDMEWALSRTIAFTFGVSYSSQSNFNSLGGNFGIGFNTYNPGIAFRFDLGMQFYSMKYDAYTVLEKTVHHLFGNDEHYTIYYHDIGESTHFDPYFNLTFNTAYRDWPVNIFINAGYVVQTLLSFEPKQTHREYWGNEHIITDARGTSTMGFINLTPGILHTPCTKRCSVPIFLTRLQTHKIPLIIVIITPIIVLTHRENDAKIIKVMIIVTNVSQTTILTSKDQENSVK